MNQRKYKKHNKLAHKGGGRGYSGAPPKRTQGSVGAGALRRHTITRACPRELVEILEARVLLRDLAKIREHMAVVAGLLRKHA